mgnify:CR=1 FL=1
MQRLVHRAYEKNLTIQPHTAHWIFDETVFFNTICDDDTVEEIAEASYTQGDAAHVYTFTVDSIANREDLPADDIAASDIQEIWGEDVDVAALIEDGDGEDEVEDGGWHIQRIRSQIARRAGYEGVYDWDEQGEIVTVDFTGRNEELNARWVYLGEYEDIRA